MAVPIFLRQEHGDTQCASSWDNRHFIYRVVFWHEAPDNRVSRLVISRVELLFLGHDHGATLGTHHDLVLGQFKLLHANRSHARSRCKQRCLVDEVCQIRTGEAGRTPRNF